MEGIKSGKLKSISDNYIFNFNDTLKTIKTLYKSRAYNDFASHKISSGIALALELANAGQISPIYKDIKMAEMLSYVAQTTECLFNCLGITGSIMSGTASILRLFGNGAFEVILKKILGIGIGK